MEVFIEQINTQTPLDWAITASALMYVFLAAKEKIACWYWGILSCSLWAYADFARYNLWVDGVLQLFYVGMGIWGLYSWRYGGKEKKALAISRLPFSKHLQLFGGGALLTVALGYVFDKFTPTALPYPDSFITAFSIFATFLTVKKILENWLYWIVLDIMAVFLFVARDAFLVACVMGVYALIAIVGYFRWRRKFAAQ